MRLTSQTRSTVPKQRGGRLLSGKLDIFGTVRRAWCCFGGRLLVPNESGRRVSEHRARAQSLEMTVEHA